MLFHDLALASLDVASMSKRTAKIDRLASVVRALAPGEIEAAVSFLVGVPRQRRIGVGWASLRDLGVVPAVKPNLTVHEVDETIARLAGTIGSGSVAARRDLLVDLFARATSEESRLLWALLAGELRQGALEGVMADAVAKAAGVPAAAVRRAAMLTGSLPVAAVAALTDGGSGLGTIGLEVMRPVQPMLASTATSPADALATTGRASVEWKLDGARIQVHRSGDDVRVFTRNLNDVTERLGLVVDIARSLPAREFVLDAEVLGLDPDGRPRIFQDTMSRFGADTVGAAAELRPFFFDLLQLDGGSLLELPLGERIELLDRVAGPWRIAGSVTDDPAEADEVLAAALRHGHEGVVVKALDSPYDAGRRGGAWRKVKPVRSLDLVVLAAEWGHGRRTGLLSNLHLGARGADGSFVMVGKTFKGLTDEMLRWQTDQFRARAIGEDHGTVWIEPTMVVEIAVDGVQVSRRYPGGVALRFARVKGYRPDKTASEADTIDSVRALLPTS